MDVLLKLGIVLVVGLIGGKIARLFKLPNVSGYLVFGLLLGPSFVRLISAGDVEAFAVISEFALGIIAFSIGSEFILKELKKLGKSIFIITLAEVVGAIFIVFLVMYFIFKQTFAFSAVIAAMSASTAPAATLLVIQQYKAHGPVTKTLIPVVALDDVFGIMAFGIAMALAKLSLGRTQTSLLGMLVGPIVEIGGSVVIGLILGIILAYAAKKATNRDSLQGMSLGTIAIATGLSKGLGFSPLLTCIVIGATVANLLPNSKRMFSSVNDFASPVYVLFFTLAGASLDLSILVSVGALGIAYIFCRAGGKMLGAWAGARAVNAEETVQKYLGLGLLPQGGISIGLSVLVRQQLPEYAVPITTIIMFSVLIYEVSGPIFAKIAIEKAGEIDGVNQAQVAFKQTEVVS
ncbi:MAG: cation:proton antiporter [Firmicutes bacterium]|nr:cation:proton antiporter [Bacillota bacterium]